MIDIRPVEFKVLIKPEEVEDQTRGGLYLPDSARTRQQFAVDRGEIIAVGAGFFKELPGPEPKIGDIVIFNRYAGSLITIEDEGVRTDYRLCNDKDICAILVKE
jgi:chaperonin GroES